MVIGMQVSGDGSMAHSTGSGVQSVVTESRRSASGATAPSRAASGAASAVFGQAKPHRPATQETAVDPSHKGMQGHGRSCGDWPGQVAFQAARLESHLFFVAENPPQQLKKPGHSLVSTGAGAHRHEVQSASLVQVSMSEFDPLVPNTPPADWTPPAPAFEPPAAIAPPVATTPPVDVAPPRAGDPAVPPGGWVSRVRSQPRRKIKADTIRSGTWQRIGRL